MHFITRERIHVDRIATAWAIQRFIDADATFEFVPRTRDLSGTTGIPFDIRGAELGHRRGRCTQAGPLNRSGDPQLIYSRRGFLWKILVGAAAAPLVGLGMKGRALAQTSMTADAALPQLADASRRFVKVV